MNVRGRHEVSKRFAAFISPFSLRRNRRIANTRKKMDSPCEKYERKRKLPINYIMFKELYRTLYTKINIVYIHKFIFTYQVVT